MTIVLFVRCCALSPGAHCQQSDTTGPVSEQMLPPELGLLLETAKSLSLLSRTDFSVLLTMIMGKLNLL
jgi:hypothetical protein